MPKIPLDKAIVSAIPQQHQGKGQVRKSSSQSEDSEAVDFKTFLQHDLATDHTLRQRQSTAADHVPVAREQLALKDAHELVHTAESKKQLKEPSKEDQKTQTKSRKPQTTKEQKSDNANGILATSQSPMGMYWVNPAQTVPSQHQESKGDEARTSQSVPTQQSVPDYQPVPTHPTINAMPSEHGVQAVPGERSHRPVDRQQDKPLIPILSGNVDQHNVRELQETSVRTKASSGKNTVVVSSSQVNVRRPLITPEANITVNPKNDINNSPIVYQNGHDKNDKAMTDQQPASLQTAKLSMLSTQAGESGITPIMVVPPEQQHDVTNMTKSSRQKKGGLKIAVAQANDLQFTKLRSSHGIVNDIAARDKAKVKGASRQRVVNNQSLTNESFVQTMSRYFAEVKGNRSQTFGQNDKPADASFKGQGTVPTMSQTPFSINTLQDNVLNTDISKWITGQALRSNLVGASTVVLTLVPEHLGKLRLTVSGSKTGHLQVKISANSASALDLLTQNAHHLQQQLENNGFPSVNINLGMDQSGSQQSPENPMQSSGHSTDPVSMSITTMPKEQIEKQYTLQDIHQGFIAEA